MVSKKSAKKAPEPQISSSDHINDLSLEELVALKSDVERLIQKKQKEKQKEIYANMLDLASVAGFNSVEEFVASRQGRNPRSDKGIKLPPKYRSQDGKSTWSGKGRVPGWVLKHEADGGSRDDLLIT